MKQNNYKVGIEGRLARLETKVDDLIGNHIKHLDEKLDQLIDRPPSREEWEKHLVKNDEHEIRIQTLENESLRLRSTIKAWGSIGGVIVVGLQLIQFVYFLKHLP